MAEGRCTAVRVEGQQATWDVTLEITLSAAELEAMAKATLQGLRLAPIESEVLLEGVWNPEVLEWDSYVSKEESEELHKGGL